MGSHYRSNATHIVSIIVEIPMVTSVLLQYTLPCHSVIDVCQLCSLVLWVSIDFFVFLLLSLLHVKCMNVFKCRVSCHLISGCQAILYRSGCDKQLKLAGSEIIHSNGKLSYL